MELDAEVAAAEKQKTGIPEHGLKFCKKLEVLYLFENRISHVSETMLNFKKLTRLYIYDNCITKMENFENLVNLQRLYLDRNMIRRLEGLQNCPRLEELTLQDQRLPRTADFTFDDYSLASIAGSLYNLNLANNQVIQCKQLFYCDRLETLDLRGNLIQDLQEELMPLLSTMRGLTKLDMRENPVVRNAKYREQVIMTAR